MIEIIGNIIGFGGGALVLYSLLTNVLHVEPWLFIERMIDTVSVLATTVGLIIVCLSIWMSPANRKADSKSYVVAVFLILASIAVIIGFFAKPDYIDSTMINGFALLAIAGSIFRLNWMDELKGK